MIDILLSTYNGERWLREQLDSILAQSYGGWRLLIRDDGSTDGTVAIVDEYAHLNPEKIVRLEESKNIGCVRSYEYLLYASTAEYICFADQDDVWLPQKLEHMLKVSMESEKNAPTDTPIVVCSDLRVVDAELHVIDESFWHMVRLRPDLLQTPQQLGTCNYVTGCAMMFNRVAKELALPFLPNAYMHDAVVALTTLYRGGKIVILPEKDILYRQHEGNVIGAIRVTKGLPYLWSKLLSMRSVWKRNKRNYLQARDITHCSALSFMYNRINYLLRR